LRSIVVAADSREAHLLLPECSSEVDRSDVLEVGDRPALFRRCFNGAPSERLCFGLVLRGEHLGEGEVRATNPGMRVLSAAFVEIIASPLLVAS
jgi:hypothetical protein